MPSTTRALGPAWLVAFTTCLLALIAVAVVALAPEPPSADQWMTERLGELASPGLEMLLLGITSLGSTFVLVVVASLAVAMLAAGGRRSEALFAVAALVSTLALNETLKRLLERARPALEWAEPATGYAFPSGHAMNSMVVYGALGLIAWRLWGPRAGAAAGAVALAVALLVGASRVYLGVHWTTDVVGGFLAGILLLLVLVAAFSVAVGRPWIGPRGRTA